MIGMRWTVTALAVALVLPGTARAQNINVLRSTEEVKEEERAMGAATGERQLAAPLGATAGITASGDSDAEAAALVGFQTWRKDQDFLAVFFSLDEAQTIQGEPADFGRFLASPTAQGNAFFVSSNWTRKPLGNGRLLGGLLVGPSGRAGLTRTSWEASLPTGAQKVEGFVAHLTAAVLVSTPTLYTGVNKDNEYQLGLEIGPTFRWIGGDLAREDAFLGAPEVLGFVDHSFSGIEAVFFARLNSAQPFLRVTRFRQRDGLPGFSGTQAVIGVSVLSALFQGTAR